MTSEKRIKSLHDLLLKYISYRMQPRKNTDPKPGFQLLLNPGFGFGKMAGCPGARVFQNLGFNP